MISDAFLFVLNVDDDKEDAEDSDDEDGKDVGRERGSLLPLHPASQTFGYPSLRICKQATLRRQRSRSGAERYSGDDSLRVESKAVPVRVIIQVGDCLARLTVALERCHMFRTSARHQCALNGIHFLHCLKIIPVQRSLMFTHVHSFSFPA